MPMTLIQELCAPFVMLFATPPEQGKLKAYFDGLHIQSSTSAEGSVASGAIPLVGA
jgi:hypothetical protein